MAITVSESAKERLQELFGKHPEAKALRVGVRGGGRRADGEALPLSESKREEQLWLR